MDNENKVNNQINFGENKDFEIMNNQSTPKYSLLDLEEFLKNNITPPGIKEYNDLPPIEGIEATQSKLTKVKKPWESENNVKNLNLDFMIKTEMDNDKIEK